MLARDRRITRRDDARTVYREATKNLIPKLIRGSSHAARQSLCGLRPSVSRVHGVPSIRRGTSISALLLMQVAGSERRRWAVIAEADFAAEFIEAS